MHDYFCDCDDCLNRGGGTKFDYLGRVESTTVPVLDAREHMRLEKRRYRQRKLASSSGV